MKQSREIEGYRYTDEHKSILMQIKKINDAKKVLNVAVGGNPLIYDDITPQLEELKRMLVENTPSEPKDFNENGNVEVE